MKIFGDFPRDIENLMEITWLFPSYFSINENFMNEKIDLKFIFFLQFKFNKKIKMFIFL